MDWDDMIITFKVLGAFFAILIISVVSYSAISKKICSEAAREIASLQLCNEDPYCLMTASDYRRLVDATQDHKRFSCND